MRHSMANIKTFKAPHGRGYTADLIRGEDVIARVFDRGDGSAPSIYPVSAPMSDLMPGIEDAAKAACGYLPSVEYYLTTLFCEAMQ